MSSQMMVDGCAEGDDPIDPEYSAEDISAYYLELDQVLDRVERAENHYQVLDLDRLATTGEVKLAYLRSVALLNPSQLGINLSVPEIMLGRIDSAFELVSRAYSTLVNFSRRMEYDDSLGGVRIPAGESESSELTGPSGAAGKTEARPNTTVSSDHAASAGGKKRRGSAGRTETPVLKVVTKLPSDDNRRLSERFKLSVPVHVTGYHRKGGRWHEATRTADVSRTGALINMRKRVKKGTVLYLTMPLPVRLRTRDFQEPTYVSYALVRRVDAPKGHATAVGVEFLGPHPPDGYLERPWDIFHAEHWSGDDRRRSKREEKREPVLIEYFNDYMECIKQETAITDNVSRGGLRVAVRAAPAEFGRIRVNSVGRGFTSFAAVCDRFMGEDGKERLCLRLLEAEWPA